MKSYTSFVKKMLEEDTLAISYKDGGEDQTIIITGSSSQIKKVKNKLPAGTKTVENVPEGAMEISASNWLKIK